MGFVRNILAILVVIIAWKYYSHNYPKTAQKPQVSGFFHPSFRKVAEVFRKNVESGLERGAAFSVYHKGEVLVDMWGGWADVGSERHWQEDTLSLSFSMVKAFSAVVIARLVDMGLLDYKKEVYCYWPEFATNDKKNITVEMLFSHQTGLIGLDEKITFEDIRDRWGKVEKLLATQRTFWPAGSARGYHGLTFGMYADALVRKVDPQHRNISQFFQEEIAKPLDIEFYIGLPKEHYHRFARTQEASLWEFRFNPLHMYDFISLLNSPYFPVMNLWEYQGYHFNSPDILAIGHPSALGVGNARGMAKFYDYIANGGSLKGKRLLSPEAAQALREPLTENIPNVFVLIFPMTRGLMVRTNKQGHETVGHPGYGGSSAFADVTAGLGFAYSTNYLAAYLFDDPREMSLVDTFYECFETYKEKEMPKRGV